MPATLTRREPDLAAFVRTDTHDRVQTIFYGHRVISDQRPLGCGQQLRLSDIVLTNVLLTRY